MSMLSPEELARLSPAESLFPSPIPVPSVSSDEFAPTPQTEKQHAFEARVKAMGADMAKRLGMSRRRFFQTAAGMATAFLAMNDTYGPVYGVSRAEAAEPERADDRAKQWSGQFIMDMHTHFLRPGTKIMTFVNQRKAVGKSGWNPELVAREQTIDDLMFTNLPAGDLPRQRHQGRVHQRRAFACPNFARATGARSTAPSSTASSPAIIRARVTSPSWMRARAPYWRSTRRCPTARMST